MTQQKPEKSNTFINLTPEELTAIVIVMHGVTKEMDDSDPELRDICMSAHRKLMEAIKVADT